MKRVETRKAIRHMVYRIAHVKVRSYGMVILSCLIGNIMTPESRKTIVLNFTVISDISQLIKFHPLYQLTYFIIVQ